MVSLRERTARPSYSNIPQGLENLSDSHSDAEPEASGSGSKAVSQIRRRRISESTARSVSVGPSKAVGAVGKDSDDEGVSSGDSSEFAPSEGGRKKKMGKGPATGRLDMKKRGAGAGAGMGSSGSESELRELGSDEDDEEGSGMDLDGDDDLEEDDLPRGKGKGKGTGKATGPPKSKTPGKGPKTNSRRVPPRSDRNPHQPLAAPPVYAQSDINLVPPAYRALIKTSAEGMVKPTQAKAFVADKTRRAELDGFPAGSGLPFTTRLVRRGGAGGMEVDGEEGSGKWEVVVEKAEDQVTRRKRAVAVDKGILGGVPREAWEGEGWWPEMYTGDGASDGILGKVGEGSKAAGKRKAGGSGGSQRLTGWTLRHEVRIGLDDVARGGMDELESVDEKEAAKYLPNPQEGITVHLGPHDQQKPVKMRMFEQYDVSLHTDLREGFIFSAGGPIWGLDWCPLPESQAAHYGNSQFLAITALPDLTASPTIGHKHPRGDKAAIQIWSVSLPNSSASAGEAGGMGCEMVLCIQGGAGMGCKWMPLGAWDDCDPGKLDQGRIPKLGILAVVQLDGSVGVHAVPHPLAVRHLKGDSAEDSAKPLFVKCHEPSVRIEVVDAAASCVDWMTSSKLAVGFSDGSVGVWDIADALLTKQKEELLPQMYLSIAQSCVSSLATGRVPPADSAGEPVYDQDPRFLVVGSWDGTATLLDVRDPGHPVLLQRQRLPSLTVGWSVQNQSAMMSDNDYNAKLFKVRGIPTQREAQITPHRGPIWDIATSEYHTMVASASADGSVIIGSAQSGYYKSKRAPMFVWRMLEMDYDKVTGHYRLADDFSGETIPLELANGRRPKKSVKTVDDDIKGLKAGNWDVEVGVHRVSWNEGSGIARAGMLAAGTASGLGVVYLVEPRWREGVDVAGMVARA